jgi:hypothetical protein
MSSSAIGRFFLSDRLDLPPIASLALLVTSTVEKIEMSSIPLPERNGRRPAES